AIFHVETNANTRATCAKLISGVAGGQEHLVSCRKRLGERLLDRERDFAPAVCHELRPEVGGENEFRAHRRLAGKRLVTLRTVSTLAGFTNERDDCFGFAALD